MIEIFGCILLVGLMVIFDLLSTRRDSRVVNAAAALEARCRTFEETARRRGPGMRRVRPPQGTQGSQA